MLQPMFFRLETAWRTANCFLEKENVNSCTRRICRETQKEDKERERKRERR